MKELKKKCARCKANKPVSQFNKQQKNLDGLQAWCKDCAAAYKEERRSKSPEFFNDKEPAF